MVMKHLFFPLALLATAAAAQEPPEPALVGPPADAPRIFTVEPDQTIEQAAARYRALRQDATRWEIAFQGLSALDAIQTCSFLASGKGREANPVFGRNPSCAKVVGIKAGLGLVHWLLFTRLRRDDPAQARKAARISVFVQGAVVTANMRLMF